MSVAAEFSTGLASIEDALGETFVWKGQEYACLISGSRKARNLDSGGFMVEHDLTLVVRRDLFTVYNVNTGELLGPEPKQTLTFRGETYRINDVTNAHEIFFRLECVFEHKGA